MQHQSVQSKNMHLVKQDKNVKKKALRILGEILTRAPDGLKSDFFSIGFESYNFHTMVIAKRFLARLGALRVKWMLYKNLFYKIIN